MTELPQRPLRLLVTRGELTQDNFSTQSSVVLQTVELAASTGIEMLQIREKNLPGRLLFELVRHAVAVARHTTIFVNERFDIALAAGAHGAHLTSTSMPIECVRASVPPGFLIGVSTHTAGEVRKAKEQEADYAMLGPVFATPGKSDPLGVDVFGRICREVTPFPVLAVGGIDGSNASEVVDAGAAGFAAIRYLNEFVRLQK